jgi:hypothetical protein
MSVDKYSFDKKAVSLKRRSPKEIIESEADSSVEHAYMKFPGKEMVDVTYDPQKRQVSFDPLKSGLAWLDSGKKQYTELHTHVDEADNSSSKEISIPSITDIRRFLSSEIVKTMVVAQQYKGKLQGYYIIRKTKETNGIDNTINMVKDLYNIYYDISNQDGVDKGLGLLAKKYKLQYRFVPAKGYKFVSEQEPDRPMLKKARFEKDSSLESKVAVAVITLALSISLFISSNLTGFSVANLTTKGLNIIGIVLFLGSLIYLAFILKREKRNN